MEKKKTRKLRTYIMRFEFEKRTPFKCHCRVVNKSDAWTKAIRKLEALDAKSVDIINHDLNIIMTIRNE